MNIRRAHILATLLCLAITAKVFALEAGKKYNFRFKDGQHLRNAVLLEETKTSYRVRLDFISEEKILEKKDLKEAPVLAHSLNPTPASGSLLAGIKTISIAFAEPTIGADKPENYSIAGNAAGTLKIVSVRRTGKDQYALQLAGEPAEGDLVIRITNITDNVGAQLISDSIEYKLDVTRPKIDATPANDSTVPALKEVSLQFSEAVRGADKIENYTLSGNGLGNLKLKMVRSESGAENRYNLTFKGNSGNGQIKIRVKNIADMVGNPPVSSEILYAADTIRPTAVAFPAPNSLLRELKSIDFSFSEAVRGADKPESYTIAGTGAGDLSIREIVRGADGHYILNFDGAPGNGTVSVQIRQVTDAAGNLLTGNTFSYRTDVTAPAFSVTPATGTSLANLAAIKITFSKTVTGAEVPGNYLIKGAGVGNLALKGIRKIKERQYELRFAGTPGDGEIILQLQNIADPVGNVLGNNSIEYLADVTPPQFKPSLAPESVVNVLKELDLQFSEPIVGAEKSENFVLSGPGAAGLQIAKVEALDADRYRVSVSGSLKNGKVVLNLNNIFDRAGNALFVNTVAYLGDITRPELLKIFPAAQATLRDLNAIELQFSEPVSGSDKTENYALSGTGRGSLSIASATTLPGNRTRLVFTGKPGEGAFALQLQNTSDLAGNLFEGPAIEYRSDVRGPVFEADIPSSKIIADLKNLTLRFSEPVSGAENVSNYKISGTGTGNLRVQKVRSEKPEIYTLDFAGSPADGEVTLAIVQVADMAGNPLASDSLTFRTDVTPPELTFSPKNKSRLNTLEEIQLQFSELVTGADRAENYRLTGEGIGSLQVAAIEVKPDNAFRLALTGKPANGKIALQVRNVADVAGNNLQNGSLAYEADSTAPSYQVSPQPGMIARNFTKIEVAYSETVSGGADIKKYALAGEGVGSLRIDRIASLPENKYQLILKGAPGTGAIQLAISDVTDLAGNPLPQTSIVYQSDRVQPTLTALPNPEMPINQLRQLTLRFSKPVTGATNPAHFKLAGGGVGSLQLEKIISAEANAYQLFFSGTPTNGSITITMEKITDQAGNAPEITEIKYQLDLTPVDIKVKPASKTKLTLLPEVELQFTKEVQGAENLNNYSLSGEYVQALKISGIENRGKNKYILRFSGEASGPIQIMLKNINDRAGNTLKNARLEYIVEIPTASQPCGDIAR